MMVALLLLTVLPATASDPEGRDALAPRSGTFGTTLERPGADLSRDTKIVPEPVELEFRERVIKRSVSIPGSMISKRTEHIGTPKRKDVKMTRKAFDGGARLLPGHAQPSQALSAPALFSSRNELTFDHSSHSQRERASRPVGISSKGTTQIRIRTLRPTSPPLQS